MFVILHGLNVIAHVKIGISKLAAIKNKITKLGLIVNHANRKTKPEEALSSCVKQPSLLPL